MQWCRVGSNTSSGLTRAAESVRVVSKQTFQVKADTCVPVDRSIFGLRAFGEETRFETDQGAVPAKLLTTQHRLRTLKGPLVGIEWIERLDLDPDTLNRYPDLKPVLISAGQFRPGVPCRNTLLSPGQKIWSDTSGEKAGSFGSARMLAENPDMFRDQDISVAYIVLACTRPSFLRAEGMWVSC